MPKARLRFRSNASLLVGDQDVTKQVSTLLTNFVPGIAKYLHILPKSQKTNAFSK